MKDYKELVDIVLDILGVNKNRPTITCFKCIRTKYNKSSNCINLSNDKIPSGIVEIAHECMHVFQNQNNTLGSYKGEDIDNWIKNKEEERFYSYQFEAEAQGFAWYFTYRFFVIIYDKNTTINQNIYNNNKKLFSKAPVLNNDTIPRIELEKLQENLNTAYETAKNKYEKIIDNNVKKIKLWYELRGTPNPRH